MNLPKSRNVFVLCTGRNGSLAFAKACSHFTNFSSGHETRINKLGDERLSYPAGHIEVDNRLAWFLGRLDESYGDDAVYVFLRRNPEDVAKSYNKRWDYWGGIMSAYGSGIVLQKELGLDVARDMVRTVEENISFFLNNKTRIFEIDIANISKDFDRFAKAIGAVGDMEAARAEFIERHNASSGLKNSTMSGLENSTAEVLAGLTRIIRDLQNQVRQESKAHQLSEQKYDDQIRKLLDSTEIRYGRLVEKAMKKPIKLLGLPFKIAALRRNIIAASKGIATFGANLSGHEKNLAVDAMKAHKDVGLQRALDIVKETKGYPHKDELVMMLRVCAANDDETWLREFNLWLNSRKMNLVELGYPSATRFLRIKSQTIDPIFDGPKVSVIMPAYNSAVTLSHAANSILMQSWKNIELLIVNDNSSDNTLAIARELEKKDARVIVLDNSTNVGPYVSKNRALLSATGVFITGHDADDWAFPDRIAKQMSGLKKSGNADAIVGSMLRLSENGIPTHPARIGKSSFDGITRIASISLLMDSSAIRQRIGFWDTVRFGADSEYIARVEKMLGSGLLKSKLLTMLCLDHKNSLTNDKFNGVDKLSGVSPVRAQYREQWSEWHKNLKRTDFFLPFPQSARRFPAPPEMIVENSDIQSMLDSDSFS